MPAVIRLGDMTCGHCYYPIPLSGASSDVFVNGIAVGRIGDNYPPHKCGNNVHQGNQSGGSSTVFVNGIAVGRIGDSLSCGDTCAQGSSDVFAGG